VFYTQRFLFHDITTEKFHLEQSAYRGHVVRLGTVLQGILRHSCSIAVTRPSDRYLTSATAAFCRHTWCSINVLIIIIILILIMVRTYPRRCRVLSLSDCRYSLNPLSQTRIDWV